MFIFRKIADIQAFLNDVKYQGKTIGFVPTMGALHQGHLSLINEASQQNSITVCSIFVNPTQFNDLKDLEKYPRTETADITLLESVGCSAVFIPEVSEMYPNGMDHLETYDFGSIEHVFDGAARPGHFAGVGQVLSRLFDIVKPDNLYMGQKDYQQCLIVKKLMEIRGDKFNIHFVPTKRQEDGLAMSSRNTRLSDDVRAKATILYQCLVSIEAQNGIKSFEVTQKECEDILRAKGFEPDYVALADADTLEPLSEYDNSRNMIALIAAFVGPVRLIDNMILKSH